MNIGPIIEVGDRPPEPLIIPSEREPESQPQQLPAPKPEPVKVPERV